MNKARTARRGTRAREPLGALKALGTSNCRLCAEKIDDPHAGIGSADLQARHLGYCGTECKEADGE